MKSYSAMESVWQIAIPKTVRSVGICVCLSFYCAMPVKAFDTLSSKDNIMQQQVKKISGVVADNLGETIIGANILVKGTSTGVITDIDGHFSLDVPVNAILQVSFIGYKTIEILVGDKQQINVVLSPDVEELDEVVVTAMGIKREKKALGYAMQEIKTDNLIETRTESVSNMLHGKIAGVQISSSGNDLGGSTRVVLRGLTSLSGKNQPLWVVDGVPINDNIGGSGVVTEYGYSEYSGGASEINPEDIESISVLKGANAAAMYGSRAQNGAILITTKKGKLEQPLSIEYNGTVNLTTAYEAYDLQNVYGQGSHGEFSLNSKSSWGPKMEGQMIENWRQVNGGDASYSSYPMLSQGSQLLDFYRTGTNVNNSIAISGGGKSMTGRLAYTDSRNNGITPDNSLRRQYIDANITFSNKWLELGMKASYIHQKANNRPDQGLYGVGSQFIRMPRSIRLADLKNPEGLNGSVINWAGDDKNYINPYVYTYKGNGNYDVKDRLIGQLNGSLIFTEWLRLNAKIGMDMFSSDTRLMIPFYFGTASNQLMVYEQNLSEINADFLLNFNKTFGDFSVLANVGTAFRNERDKRLNVLSGRFQMAGLISLSNSSTITPEEYLGRKKVNSVLGNAQLGYKSAVFVDVTARNDWSSTLPKDNWSYFYPSVSLSGVISQLIDMPEEISFLKVRGSWAKVGNDTDPYVLTATYNTWALMSPTMVSTAPMTQPLSTLKPESTQSWEAGLDMRMFQGRIGLDFTYYKTETTNQIMNIPVSASTGYINKLINAGKMSSHGVEIMLNGTPIRMQDWQWDLTLNWGMSTSRCEELHPDIKRFELGGTSIGTVVVREGEKFGDIIGKAYKRNEAGEVLVDDRGLPLYESDRIVGNMMPDWTGSIQSTLRWKDLSFSMLIDVKQGGDVISMTDAIACASGNSTRTLAYRDGGMVVRGVNVNTGIANAKEISAQDFYEEVGGAGGVTEEFLYDGSYVKMREMSLGWNIPKRWLLKTPLQSIKFSVVGRDLFFFHKNTPGNPEGANSRSDYAQAFENTSMPPTRSFGFNLNIKF